jgi:polyhydroxyalkanoate synthesis regulator phasin
MKFRELLLPLLTAAAGVSPVIAQNAAPDERGMNELRHTVVNLLDGLVARGIITREQAQQMVKDAQDKAAADVAADAALAEAEKDAVRVPYVPQVVKDEIKRDVTTALSEEVTRNVVEAAQTEGWGLPAALPDWVRRMNWSGDVRVRAEGHLFAAGNLEQGRVAYLNVNERGGKIRAGLAQYANTTVDRERLRARFRLGFDAPLGWGWSLGARLATGTLRDPVSANQTMGNTAARYQTGLELAYIKWAGSSRTSRQQLEVQGGRIANPWVSTDLVFDQDLVFEGISASYRLGLGRSDPQSSYAYLTVGGFPIQEVELARDKWLVAAQLGAAWRLRESDRLRVGAALYDYRNIEGRLNAFDSTLLDYTAPQFLQGGNTLFDIRNDNDATTNLYALASSFRIADVTASYEWRASPGFRVVVTGDYVRNLGFDANEIRARTGFDVARHVGGYQGEISLGSVDMARTNAWRAYFGYRYLERDAVLDAFTDSDFRLGGTDVKGYFFGGEWSITPRVQARLRYMSGDEIHGTLDQALPAGFTERVPFGVDVLQVDMTARF